MLLLSDLLGSDVRSVDGAVVGHLVDLAIKLGEVHPAVRYVAIGRRGHIRSLVEWNAVLSFEHDDIQLSITRSAMPARNIDAGLSESGLLLVRDVLDTQIVDVAGKRLARVSEVLLARADDAVRVAAVDVGAAGIWRRLGIDRFAERTPERAVDWADLHLTSARGHALQLATTDAVLHRLSGTELASVVARLPTDKGADVLAAVSPTAAAGALSASHPKVGARLLHAVPRATASTVVAHMPIDDMAAVLRGLPPETVEDLLASVTSERAATVRRLLRNPPNTAGGLMNTEFPTARVGEDVAAIRDRVAANLPEFGGLATVFVVDDADRPVGSFEPNDLLAGRKTARQVPTVPMSLPVEQVINLFALHDYSALPVVDGDGRLVGVVAIDDVLEELLAERLPGLGPFARVRRRHRVLHPRRQESDQGSAER